MDKFKLVSRLSEGTYGVVYKAKNEQTGEEVAVKKMKDKFYTWDQCMQLREIKGLLKMNHRNIVKLREVVRENASLYMVFECMEENMYQRMSRRKFVFGEREVRHYVFQVLAGVAYMHRLGIIHRDLKPENLLMKGDIVKIADFGLAKGLRTQPPYTEYVSTRWYRAPEVILRCYNYSSPIDLWAVGCMAAEFLTFVPLFPGKNEIDQLFRICSLLGTPQQNGWAEGGVMTKQLKINIPEDAGSSKSIRGLLHGVSDKMVRLIEDLLKLDPKRRPTGRETLSYPVFSNNGYIPDLSLPDLSEEISSMSKQGGA
eukprot:Nk52_evm18s158 gene=Nk52_evmTU18s158